MMKRFSGSHSRSSGLTLSAGAINKTKQQEQKNKTKKNKKKKTYSAIYLIVLPAEKSTFIINDFFFRLLNEHCYINKADCLRESTSGNVVAINKHIRNLIHCEGSISIDKHSLACVSIRSKSRRTFDYKTERNTNRQISNNINA